jgi:hypothetical protein
MSGALVRYEEMRVAVETCARIDEAAEMRDKAAALAAYARQRDDRDLEVWMQEIKLRASVRIGELVRELESHQGARTDTSADRVAEVVTKEHAVRDAGLSPSTARSYQELAGPRDQQAQKAGKAAAEVYFAKARATKTPATMDGLRGAVKDAVHATIGPPPPRPSKSQPIVSSNPIGTDWVDWTTAVKAIATLDADLEDIADRSSAFRASLLKEARAALPRLRAWIEALERKDETKRSAA